MRLGGKLYAAFSEVDWAAAEAAGDGLRMVLRTSEDPSRRVGGRHVSQSHCPYFQMNQIDRKPGLS